MAIVAPLKLMKKRLGGSGFRLLILSALVGIVSGAGALAFYYTTNAVDHLVLHNMGHYRPPVAGAVVATAAPYVDALHMHTRWYLYLLPMLGGLISGWLVYTYAPEAEGHGTDGAIEAFHQRSGLIRTRVPIIKSIASVATIGTGGSAGREGWFEHCRPPDSIVGRYSWWYWCDLSFPPRWCAICRRSTLP